MPTSPRGLAREQQFSSAAASKPSGGIRSLHLLSAWGLPTPVVAFSCIGNVDIQVLSGAGGQLYLIRRLQVYLFIIFHVQPISQGVTLLFFFAEKKKRSKKRKEFAFHLCYKIKYHTKITQRTATQHNPTMYEPNNKTPCTFSCREFCFLPALCQRILL